MSRTTALIADISAQFPRFRMKRKAESSLCRIIDRLLYVATLGGQSRFMTEYHTVLGETLYLAARWDSMTDEQRYVLLRHERVHLEQRRRLGMCTMAFVYLVPILPMGLALGRARLEWEAYEETLRATVEVYGSKVLDDSSFKGGIIDRFTGPDYGFMWPFPNQVARWYEEAKVRILARPPPEVGQVTKNEGYS